MEKDIRVWVSGERLNLSFRPGARLHLRQGLTNPKARITVPRLTGLESSGASDVSLKGFDEPNLDIELSGATQLIGSNCRIGELELEASGAAKIDLRASRVRDADITVSGAGEIDITMDGGQLTVDLSGAVELTYYGEVSSKKIETSGAASVTEGR
jgi:hypothetical protein